MLKKIKNKSLSQNFDTILNILFILFFVTITFLEWQGRGLPQESELQYSEGIITNTEFSIAIQPTNNPNQYMLFGCSYNVFSFVVSGSCMSPKYLEPIIGKNAVIGWYYQSSFLGRSNKLPQLVTLEVEEGENDLQITYEDTAKLIFNLNITRALTFLFIGSFFIFFMTKLNIIINRPILYKEK